MKCFLNETDVSYRWKIDEIGKIDDEIVSVDLKRVKEEA